MRLIGAHEVCVAVEDVLRDWMPSAVATYCPDLPQPEHYGMPEPEAFVNGDNMPAVIVSSPGLSGDPVSYGDGTYDAAYEVVVTVYARGASYADAAYATRSYAKCVRAILLQQGSLNGFAQQTEWLAEDFDPVDRSTARTLGAAFVRVRVSVERVVDATQPPTTPPTPPAAWGDGPVALSTHTTVHPAL